MWCLFWNLADFKNHTTGQTYTKGDKIYKADDLTGLPTFYTCKATVSSDHFVADEWDVYSALGVGAVEEPTLPIQSASGFDGITTKGLSLNENLKIAVLNVSPKGTAISGGDAGTTDGNKINAFDGDGATRWISSQTGTAVSGAAYIGQTFSENILFKKIRIAQDNRSTYGLTSVKLQASDDGTTWTDIGTYNLNITSDFQEIVLDIPKFTKNIRLLANGNLPTGNGWNVYSLEIHAYTPTFGVAIQEIAQVS